MATADPLPADDMLCEPHGGGGGGGGGGLSADDAPALTRAVLDYTTNNQRFSLDKKIYGQYFQLYFMRLMLLKPRLQETVAATWPDAAIVKVLDLKEGEECVVMGTLYKDMRLRPSILDEYTKDAGLAGSDVGSGKFIAGDDTVVLEDEGARVKLGGAAVHIPRLVTGIIMAARGRVVAGGEFEADAVCFPAPAPQRPPPLPSTLPGGAGDGDKYVAIVSGLSVGDPAASPPVRLELMIDYVTGHLGGAREQATAAGIVRVIIAGGALPKVDVPTASLDPRQQASVARPLRELDVLLTQLAASVPVDLMPGEGDPTNQALPQQPLHPCMFPEAGRYSPGTFAACTNPHDFSVGGVDFLGTSGQNISNLCKYTNVRGAGAGVGAGTGGAGGGGGDGGGGAGRGGGAGESGPDHELAPEEQLDLMEATLTWQHVVGVQGLRFLV
jgi:DNA polymerase delta subunit 2